MDQVRDPHPALRPYVTAYHGYEAVLDPRAVHHGLPSPTLTVILAFDDPLDCGWLETPDDHAHFWTSAAGLHAEPALIRTHGRLHGMQLALTPLGARALLGVPAGALRGVIAGHQDLPGGVALDMHAQLAALTTWGARFDLLDRHLLARLSQHEEACHRVPSELQEAWRLLERSAGRVSVSSLAERVGWGRRRLHAAFTGEYGVSPKQAARIVRFDHARRLVDSGRDLAEVAAAAGYSDQAHLSRDWRALAGRTPTQLRSSPYHVA